MSRRVEPESERSAESEVRDLELRFPPAPPPEPDTVAGRARPGALFRWGFFRALGALAAVAAAAAVYSVRELLLRVLVALFLAVSLDPAVRWLEGGGVRRGLAVGLIFAVFVAILGAFLLSIIPPLAKQVGELVGNLPHYLAGLQRRSAQFRELDRRYDLSSRL